MSKNEMLALIASAMEASEALSNATGAILTKIQESGQSVTDALFDVLDEIKDGSFESAEEVIKELEQDGYQF